MARDMKDFIENMPNPDAIFRSWWPILIAVGTGVIYALRWAKFSFHRRQYKFMVFGYTLICCVFGGFLVHYLWTYAVLCSLLSFNKTVHFNRLLLKFGCKFIKVQHEAILSHLISPQNLVARSKMCWRKKTQWKNSSGNWSQFWNW